MTYYVGCCLDVSDVRKYEFSGKKEEQMQSPSSKLGARAAITQLRIQLKQDFAFVRKPLLALNALFSYTYLLDAIHTALNRLLIHRNKLVVAFRKRFLQPCNYAFVLHKGHQLQQSAEDDHIE